MTMKKYLQIGIVVIIFAALVIFRQLKGSDEAPVVGNNNSSNTIIPQTQNFQTNSSDSSTPTPSTSGKSYKDGTYTGSVADAYYGNIQVQVTISGGKMTDVQFLQYPNDNRTSIEVNAQAMPLLKSEALTAQSAQVDIISGASQTSQAFQQSLSSALQQAS